MRKFLNSKVSKYFFYMLLVAFLVGCSNDEPLKHTQPKVVNNNIKVIKIDNCEYILYEGYRRGGLIHKFNCNNPNHNCN